MAIHKRWTTAREFVEKVEGDPEFHGRKHALNVRHQEETERCHHVLIPVVREINEAGFCVVSLDELPRNRAVYKVVMPILLSWLPRISDSSGKESIVRSLSVPWARPAAIQPLIREFLVAPTNASGLKWAIGNALEIVADRTAFDQICELAKDPSHGTARQMIVIGLGKMNDPRARELLADLVDDDDVSGHALSALMKIGIPPKARRYIEARTEDPRSWVRRQARKALAKLEGDNS